MKKIVILFVLILWAATAQAQRTLLPEVTGISAIRDGDRVLVTLRAVIPRRSAAPGITLIHAPLITDGTYRVSLLPIVVQGRRADIVWQRHERAAGTMSRHERAYYAQNGETVDYRAEVLFQHWMHDARIELETVTAGCADSFTGRSILTASILPAPPSEPEPEPEVIPPPPPPSVGELLAQTFPFVLPFSEFDPNEPIRFYDDERDNALTVYYRINRYDIELEYADNRQTLVNLLAAIEVIGSSEGVRVEKMVVAGFASPEGPFALNDRLAWERAVSVKEYILQNSSVPDEDILVFNGSLDWRGLRQQVIADSRVPLRKEVLEALDGVQGRDLAAQRRILNRLRTLGGGQSYAWLADRIFPLLRNGTFIRVYFSEND